MEMVLALQKAHVGVQEASRAGKPQLRRRVPWVPSAGRLPDPRAVPGGLALARCPGKPGATPAPGGHPHCSHPQGRAGPRVALSRRERYSRERFQRGWLSILGGAGDAANGVERGCKMGWL